MKPRVSRNDYSCKIDGYCDGESPHGGIVMIISIHE